MFAVGAGWGCFDIFSKQVGWFVCCSRFNGSLRQYFSLNRAFSQTGRKKNFFATVFPSISGRLQDREKEN